MGINSELLARCAPRPGRYALLPDLTPRQNAALLCRVLHREGYDDHIAGHITVRQADGTYLANPWELTWGELTGSDILRLDRESVLLVANGIRQAHLRAITLEWRCRMAWRVEMLGGGVPLPAEVSSATGQRTDANGFPFLW